MFMVSAPRAGLMGVVFITALSGILGKATAYGADPPVTAFFHSLPAPLLADIAPPDPARRREQRENAVSAATMLILGIATIGVAMIGLTILWGVRIRRNLRRNESKSTPLDPLWYLRSRTRRPTHDPPAADNSHRPSDPRDADDLNA